MKFPKSLLAAFCVLAAALTVYTGLKAWNAYSEHYKIGIAARDRDTITVAGEGKIKTTPDIARISLGVQTDADTVKEAQAENTKKMNAIIEAVKKLGVAKEDIATESYYINPKIDWKEGKQNIIGYTVNQSVSVKVRDLDKMGDVLAKAGELGLNQVGGIDFTIDDQTSLQAAARLKAIEDARSKAEVLAKQLGLTLVKVVSFSESSGGMPLPYYARNAMEGMGGGGAPAPTIEPGQREVVSDVSVTFEVR